MSPNRLLINWKEQSIQYYQEESPIRQAMIATANAGPAPKVVPAQKVDKKKPTNYKPATEGVAGMLASGGTAKRGTSTITFI